MSDKKNQLKTLTHTKQLELIFLAVFNFIELYVSNKKGAAPKEQKIIAQIIKEQTVTEEHLIIYLVTRMDEELQNGDHKLLYNIGFKASSSVFMDFMQKINKKPIDANLLAECFAIYMKKHLFDS